MYPILKQFIRLALLFYTKKVSVHFDKETSFNSPKIIACNHPNSFFDAIIIAIYYPKPIYFLARGDAFKKPLIAKILKTIHLIPIYRISEGRSHLSKNDDTFKKCISLLKNKETILIFSEGVCVNEWKLRSLKKGTARLTLMAKEFGIENLTIQPTNINYSSFTEVPKNILLNFNKGFQVHSIDDTKEIEFYTTFNSDLKRGITKGLLTEENKQVLKLNDKKNQIVKKLFWSIPAFLGWVTQKWFYNSIKSIVVKKTKNTVFYDSVLFGILLITYPLFVLLISMTLGILFHFKIGLFCFITLPILAYAYKYYKAI